MLSREEIIRAILQLEASDKSLAGNAVQGHSPELYRDACEAFATWEIALRYAGVVSHRRPVDKESSGELTADDVHEMIRLECANRRSLLAALIKHRVPHLHAAAIKLFESWENAVIGAGIGPEDTLERLGKKDFYDQETIVRLLRECYARGESMAQFTVMQSEYLLGISANKVIGSWSRTLEIAEIPQSRSAGVMRTWSKRSVALSLRKMASDGDCLQDDAAARSDPHLHASAIRLFGSWDEACKTIEGDLPPVEERS